MLIHLVKKKSELKNLDTLIGSIAKKNIKNTSDFGKTDPNTFSLIFIHFTVHA